MINLTPIALGRAKEAEELHRQAFEAKKLTLGPDHPSTLTSENNLASALIDLGQLDEAEAMLWPAAGSADTELGVLMEPEVDHGETEVYARVQA